MALICAARRCVALGLVLTGNEHCTLIKTSANAVIRTSLDIRAATPAEADVVQTELLRYFPFVIFVVGVGLLTTRRHI